MQGGLFLILLVAQAVSSCPRECWCDSHAKVVNCRGRGLYDIPRKLHPETLELHLQDNHIRGLSSMSFRETPYLRVLNLANNSITMISPSALLGLRNLKTLILANNSIRELDRRLLGSIRNLTHLDLSHNNIAVLPGALADSLYNLTHFLLHFNRLVKLDRIYLDSLRSLQMFHLNKNPWKCDCHMIGLKLWLETYTFKGGRVDSIPCHEPPSMRDRDLRHVPYELFHTCMSTSYSYLFANIQHLERQQWLLRGISYPTMNAPLDKEPECVPKLKARPINLRHAIATVIITGIVCGIVCLMMLAAAVYGCVYAALMAKYQRKLKKQEDGAGSIEKDKIDRDGKKELLENAIA